jgi:hypothetical protein
MGVPLPAPVAVAAFLLDLCDPCCRFRSRLFRSGRPPALVWILLLPAVGVDSEVASSEGMLGSLFLVLRRNMKLPVLSIQCESKWKRSNRHRRSLCLLTDVHFVFVPVLEITAEIL